MRQKTKEELDVDVRFLLANERTLLAWIRTALAVTAAGLAIIQIGNPSDNKAMLGILVILLGAVMSLIGYIRFKDADNAIRSGRLPEMGKGPKFQVLAVVVFAIVVAGFEVIRISSN